MGGHTGDVWAVVTLCLETLQSSFQDSFDSVVPATRRQEALKVQARIQRSPKRDAWRERTPANMGE